MLGVYGYRYKKDLKAAVGSKLQFVETSLHGPEYKADGIVNVVGPDAYTKRDWYATVTMEKGLIKKVT